jgi:hypothetical protein
MRCRLKINIKLGGINYVVNGISIKLNTMVVGADVTHPGRGPYESAPSIAGVVATAEHNYVHYIPPARLQSHNTEVSYGLLGLFSTNVF